MFTSHFKSRVVLFLVHEEDALWAIFCLAAFCRRNWKGYHFGEKYLGSSFAKTAVVKYYTLFPSLKLYVFFCLSLSLSLCLCVWPQISRPDSLYVDNILQVSIIAFSSYQTMIRTHVKQVFWNFEIMLLTKSGFKLQQGCPCFKKHKYTMLFPLRMSLNTATICSSLVGVVGKGTRFHSNKWQQNNMTRLHLLEL